MRKQLNPRDFGRPNIVFRREATTSMFVALLGGRQEYPHEEAPARKSPVDFNVGLMQVGDACNKCQSDTASPGRNVLASIEARENGRMLRRIDARAIVLDMDHGVPSLTTNDGAAIDLDGAAVPPVNECVVDKIANEYAHLIDIAMRQATFADQVKPRAPQAGLDAEFMDDVLAKIPQVDWLQIGRMKPGIEPGKIKQLVCKAMRAVGDLQQLPDCLILAVDRPGTQRNIGLYLKCGQGRAQFVGGIGNELALGLDGSVHPAKQRVERADQRAKFGGYLIGWQGCGVECSSLAQALGYCSQRSKRGNHGPPHQQADNAKFQRVEDKRGENAAFSRIQSWLPGTGALVCARVWRVRRRALSRACRLGWRGSYPSLG